MVMVVATAARTVIVGLRIQDEVDVVVAGHSIHHTSSKEHCSKQEKGSRSQSTSPKPSAHNLSEVP